MCVGPGVCDVCCTVVAMWLRCVYINHLNIYTAFLQCTGGSIQCHTNWGWIIVVLLTSHCFSLSLTRTPLHYCISFLHQCFCFLFPVGFVCLWSLSVSSWAATILRTQLYYECFIFLLLCSVCFPGAFIGLFLYFDGFFCSRYIFMIYCQK